MALLRALCRAASGGPGGGLGDRVIANRVGRQGWQGGARRIGVLHVQGRNFGQQLLLRPQILLRGHLWTRSSLRVGSDTIVAQKALRKLVITSNLCLLLMSLLDCMAVFHDRHRYALSHSAIFQDAAGAGQFFRVQSQSQLGVAENTFTLFALCFLRQFLAVLQLQLYDRAESERIHPGNDLIDAASRCRLQEVTITEDGRWEHVHTLRAVVPNL